MIKISWLILFSFLLFQDDPDPLRFKDEIERFKKEDQIHPVDPGVYLFLGSSSIRMWQSLTEDFSEYPVINRGFGGSHISDVMYYFEDLVTTYDPTKIIFYEGDNDLASGKSPSHVFADFKEFHKRVREELPGTEIGFIAAKPSPSRWHLREKYEEFNDKIENYSKDQEDITFINIYDPMINDQDRPEPSYYISDSLHMSDKGYDLWQRAVLPFIDN